MNKGDAADGCGDSRSSFPVEDEFCLRSFKILQEVRSVNG